MPLQQKLLRSFDPATMNAATGDNALHEMFRLFYLDSVSVWDYKLAELLIDRGVSVHARNKKGRTPLLEIAAHHRRSTATGLRLLLAHGAHLNVQDGDGNGLLHLMILCGPAAVADLEELMCGDEVTHLDLHLVNYAGHTASDLAAVKLAQLGDSNANSPAKRIQRLMVTQMATWTKLVRPMLLRCLESALPVTDVAKLALGYVDGSGLPFITATDSEADSDEKADPATAAAAAAAQS